MTWTEKKLNELITTPSEALMRFVANLTDDIAVLGAGGKVGSSVAILAKRAIDAVGNSISVYAVSRFSDRTKTTDLEAAGVRCISADLSKDDDLTRLPDFKNIIFMAGRKFGTTGAAAPTWEANASVPTLVTRRFKGARFVVFSTGNIYPIRDPLEGGCQEDCPPNPIGEYAMSSLARERIFEYAASAYGSEVTLFRLNFAIDLRYGVLFDIADQIMNGTPVSLTVPQFNCIWQGYVSEVAIRSLGDASKDVFTLNVTGPETNTTKSVALKLSKLLNKPATFGPEGTQSFLSDASLCMRMYGYPPYSIDQLIEWQAQWILDGGRAIGAPTHFEMNEGKF